MANREKGELSLEVEGKTYVLRPTVNAICELEDLTGKTFAEVIVQAQAGRVKAMRDLFWAFLLEQHGDEIKTPKDAGDWMARAGGFERLNTALRDVAGLNQAEAVAGAQADPPAAQASTGAPSTSGRAG